MRDIEQLLTHATRGANLELDPNSPAQSSVLNYGLPSLAGVGTVSVDEEHLARKLTDILVSFDERLDSDSVVVRKLVRSDGGTVLALIYDVYCTFSWDGITEPLRFRVFIDCSSGSVQILNEEDID